MSKAKLFKRCCIKLDDDLIFVRVKPRGSLFSTGSIVSNLVFFNNLRPKKKRAKVEVELLEEF